jgi:dTDP-4-amino-4,6-dideoxygalactose transaminase
MKDPLKVIESININVSIVPKVNLEIDYAICKEAANEVAEIVKSGRISYWWGGVRTRSLERKISDLVGRKDAFFHNSGSAALLTGLAALGVHENSRVAITSAGFVSSINAVYHCRARPIFLPTSEETLVVQNDLKDWVGDYVDVALLTQFLGNVIDVKRVKESVKANYVLEDASQALGSIIDGRYVGSHGDIATFAGSQKKLLGSGQGGINVYDNPLYGERMRRISHHGKAYTQYGEVPGFNFYGGEIEATLALFALDQLEEKASCRERCGNAMIEILERAGLRCSKPPVGYTTRVAWFDVAILLPEEWISHRNMLVEYLLSRGYPAWYYPSLIEVPWVRIWMEDNGWWSDKEEELLDLETKLWGRVLVISTQLKIDDGKKCAEILCDLLV